MSLKYDLFSSNADEGNGFFDRITDHKFSNGNRYFTKELVGFVQGNPMHGTTSRVRAKSANSRNLSKLP